MKKLFTFAVALASFIAASAQAPAEWNKGDNVAAALGLGDIDGTSFSGAVGPNDDTNRPHDKVVQTMGDYWKVEGDMPNEFLESFDGHIGIYGFYDKKQADMYQVVKFPAGAYTVKVQALYREGTPADNFTNHFNKKYMKYGHLYADALASEDPNSNVTRSYDRVLSSLATANQTSSVYYYGDGSWMNDYDYESKEVDEEGNKIHYYCPQCLVGLSEYFALGKYENTMKIVVTDDTYIRLGFRKTGYITADWLVFTNLQVIYDGPADEDAKMALAEEEYVAALDNLEGLQADVEALGFPALASLISDAVLESNDAVGEAKTEAEIVAVKDNVEKTIDNVSATVQFVKNLNDLLSSCADMLASTDFPAYSSFESAVSKANDAALTEDAEALGDDPLAYYQGIYNSLSKDRADYLNSQEADEKGAKDFTSLVKNPWFVNPEYNPNHNDDGTWTLSEGTWGWGSVGNPGSYAEKKNGRTDISSDVVLAPSDDVTNQWYKANKYTGWSSGMALMYQAGLIGVSDGWNSLNGGTIGIEQQLVGLPNGFYSLKALVRGNNGDAPWDGKSREAFAQNSKGEIVVSETVKNDGDRGWSNNWWEWNPAAWADVETAIISAEDGKLLIGGRCSKVANWTGFRLYFYGTTLDFNSKLQEQVAKVQATIDGLLFAGDAKIANEHLAKIEYPITDSDSYNAALVFVNEAKNYADLATTKQGSWKATETISNVIEYEFADPAVSYIMAYGESDADTYERVDELNENANMYVKYAAVYDKANTLNDATVNGIIAKQVAEMKEGMKNSDEIGAYMDELSLPYNIAILASLGAAEATEANPVNFSQVIINPDFTDNPTNGWTGETPTNNEYAYDTNGKRVNAELWNKSAFTLSQDITGLPAGTYELRVKAIYRDGGAVNQELVDAYNEAGSEEAWAHNYAKLFAKSSDENKQTSYIKAIESLKYTEMSFTQCATGYDSEEFTDGTVKIFPTSIYAIEGTPETEATANYTFVAEGAYPLDTKVGDYYYPASMQGFLQICQKDPEAVTNKVQITIENGESLTIGIEKTTAIGSDWVIFDDFELYYLSGDTFKNVVTEISSINTVETSLQGAKFNLAGQRVNNTYKGIVIQNGKKIMVK